MYPTIYIYTTTSFSHVPRKMGGKECVEVHKLTPHPVYGTLQPTLLCVHACMSVCVCAPLFMPLGYSVALVVFLGCVVALLNAPIMR